MAALGRALVAEKVGYNRLPGGVHRLVEVSPPMVAVLVRDEREVEKRREFGIPPVHEVDGEERLPRLDDVAHVVYKCPWDSTQTFDSLRCLTIEETYELTDAIIEKNYNEMRTELGDLMLHLVFYAKIGDEKGLFNITDVLNGICEKLIRRHPHIFSTTQV